MLGGQHLVVKGELKPLKTHGFRAAGHWFVALGVLSEAVAIVGHVKANEKYSGSSAFDRFSEMEKIGQTAAISAVSLAVVFYLVDWLVNRDNVEPGPPYFLPPPENTVTP